VLIGALVPLVVKFLWDRSGSWLRKLLEMPANPDRETARFVTARIVKAEPTSDPKVWRYTVRVENASPKPVFDVSINFHWPDVDGKAFITNYSVGALRRENSSTFTEAISRTDQEHEPTLELRFSFGDETWVRSGVELRPVLSDGEWHRLQDRQRRIRQRRLGVAALVGAPLIVLVVWLSYPLWAPIPPPSEVTYIVSPDPIGPNLWGVLGKIRSSSSINMTTTQGWRARLIAPVFPRPPLSESVTAVDAEDTGEPVPVSCIQPSSHSGGPLAQLASDSDDPGDWMFLHDLRKEGPGTPVQCSS
jgi:hypothetical protein